MATKEVFYRGAQGNLSLLNINEAVTALAANGEKVLYDEIPLGTEINQVAVLHDNLGENTAFKVELRQRDGTVTELVAATASTAAGTVFVPLKPYYLDDKGEGEIVFTNTGTAAASGNITVQVQYRFKGY